VTPNDADITQLQITLDLVGPKKLALHPQSKLTPPSPLDSSTQVKGETFPLLALPWHPSQMSTGASQDISSKIVKFISNVHSSSTHSGVSRHRR